MNVVADFLRMILLFKSFRVVASYLASPTRFSRGLATSIELLFNYLKSLNNLSVFGSEPRVCQIEHAATNRNCRDHAVAETLRLILLNSFFISPARPSKTIVTNANSFCGSTASGGV